MQAQKQEKKIAIFHNFLDNIGGAEIVALTMARELGADVYTTNIDKEKISAMGFGDVIGRIYSIGRIPINAPFRNQSAFFKFRKLNLIEQGKKYDFYIIAGDWAMSAAVNHGPNIWYAHSPLNELWAFKKYIRANLLSWWKRPLYDVWSAWIGGLSRAYCAKVDIILCNSENTKARIRKYYGKDAEVLNPPIETAEYRWQPAGEYWLSVNRLIPHKRIEMQIEAFSSMPDERLIIVGSYEKNAKQFESYKARLEKLGPDETRPRNIEIIHWADRPDLLKLYSNCKGFVTTAKDEDFGMTAVEAMAAGKPVVAPNEGGYKETVIDGETGVLITDIDAKKVMEGVKVISMKAAADGGLWYKDKCIEAAQRFDTGLFVERLRTVMARPRNR